MWPIRTEFGRWSHHEFLQFFSCGAIACRRCRRRCRAPVVSIAQRIGAQDRYAQFLALGTSRLSGDWNRTTKSDVIAVFTLSKRLICRTPASKMSGSADVVGSRHPLAPRASSRALAGQSGG
jgi:hypothetical protein